jgi:uroporphyrin-III C-methyltransferase
MALTNIEEITNNLVAAGRDKGESVAVISKATTRDQKVLISTLGECNEMVKASDIQPPVLFVVGPVVKLRDGLDWLGALSGRQLDADPLKSGKDT